MGKHSRPDAWENADKVVAFSKVKSQKAFVCPAHENGVHYYGTVSIDESECRCGARIRANNSGHG